MQDQTQAPDEFESTLTEVQSNAFERILSLIYGLRQPTPYARPQPVQNAPQAAPTASTVPVRVAVSDSDYVMRGGTQLIAYTKITAARAVSILGGPQLGLMGGVTVKDESGSCSVGNTITITPVSGLIDGAATKVLNSAYAVANLYSDGANLFSR